MYMSKNLNPLILHPNQVEVGIQTDILRKNKIEFIFNFLEKILFRIGYHTCLKKICINK